MTKTQEKDYYGAKATYAEPSPAIPQSLFGSSIDSLYYSIDGANNLIDILTDKLYQVLTACEIGNDLLKDKPMVSSSPLNATLDIIINKQLLINSRLSDLIGRIQL